MSELTPAAASAAAAAVAKMNLIHVPSKLIHRCLTYLTLSESIPFTHASHFTLHVSRTAPCRDITYHGLSHGLLALAHSSLRYHLTTIQLGYDLRRQPIPELDEEDMGTLKKHFMNLQAIKYAQPGVDEVVIDRHFQANLRELMSMEIQHKYPAMSENEIIGVTANNVVPSPAVAPLNLSVASSTASVPKSSPSSTDVLPPVTPAISSANISRSMVPSEPPIPTPNPIANPIVAAATSSASTLMKPEPDASVGVNTITIPIPNLDQPNDDDDEDDEPSVIFNESTDEQDGLDGINHETRDEQKEDERQPESCLKNNVTSADPLIDRVNAGISPRFQPKPTAALIAPISVAAPSGNSNSARSSPILPLAVSKSPAPLTLILIGARNLRPPPTKQSNTPLIDPYVSITALWNGRKWKSKIIKHSAHPIWKEKFVIDLPADFNIGRMSGFSLGPSALIKPKVESAHPETTLPSPSDGLPAVSSQTSGIGGVIRQQSDSSSQKKGLISYQSQSSLNGPSRTLPSTSPIASIGSTPSTIIPFPSNASTYSLRLRVYHKELFSKILLGEIILSLNDLALMAERQRDVFVPLKDKLGGASSRDKQRSKLFINPKKKKGGPNEEEKEETTPSSSALIDRGDLNLMVTFDPVSSTFPRSLISSTSSASALSHHLMDHIEGGIVVASSDDGRLPSSKSSMDVTRVRSPMLRRRSQSEEARLNATEIGTTETIATVTESSINTAAGTTGSTSAAAATPPASVRSRAPISTASNQPLSPTTPRTPGGLHRKALSVDFGPGVHSARRTLLAPVLDDSLDTSQSTLKPNNTSTGGLEPTSKAGQPIEGSQLLNTSLSESSIIQHTNYVYNELSPGLEPSRSNQSTPSNTNFRTLKIQATGSPRNNSDLGRLAGSPKSTNPLSYNGLKDSPKLNSIGEDGQTTLDSMTLFPPPKFDDESVASTVAQLRADLAAAVTGRLEAESKAITLESQLTDAKKELSALKDEMATMTKPTIVSTALENQRKETEKKLTTVTQELKQLQVTHGNLKMAHTQELDLMRSKLLVAVSESAAFAAYKKSTVAYVKNIQHQLQNSLIELKLLNENVETLEANLAKKEEQYNHMKEKFTRRIDKLQEANQKLTTENQGFTYQVEHLSDELSTMSEELHDAESEISSFESLVQQKDHDYHESLKTLTSFASRTHLRLGLELLQPLREIALIKEELAQLQLIKAREEQAIEGLRQHQKEVDQLREEHRTLTQDKILSHSTIDELQRSNLLLMEMLDHERRIHQRELINQQPPQFHLLATSTISAPFVTAASHASDADPNPPTTTSSISLMNLIFSSDPITSGSIKQINPSVTNGVDGLRSSAVGSETTVAHPIPLSPIGEFIEFNSPATIHPPISPINSYALDAHPSSNSDWRKNIEEIDLAHPSSTGVNHAVGIVPPSPRLVGIELNPGPTQDEEDVEPHPAPISSLAAASSSVSTCPTSATSTQSVVRITPATMFKDGLRIISTYLDQRDWLSSLQVCHHWLVSFSSSTSRGISYPLQEDGTLRSLPPSRLQHHFTSFDDRYSLFLTVNQLFSISREFPELSGLFLKIQPEPHEQSQTTMTSPLCSLSIHLRQLHVHLDGETTPSLIRAISSCISLEWLSLSEVSDYEEFSCFQSYDQLVNLTSFTLTTASFRRVSGLSIPDRRPQNLLVAMKWNESGGGPPPNLRHFNICYGRPEYFSLASFSLFRMTKLEEISLPPNLKEGNLALILSGAPNLRTIDLSGTLPLTELNQLKEFKSLRSIRIWSAMFDQNDEYETDLIAALCDCISLTSINFNHWTPRLLSSWVELSHLRELHELIFERCLPNLLDDLLLNADLLPMHSVRKLVFKNPGEYLSKYIRDYFHSSLVMPHLCHIEVTDNNEEVDWIWTKDGGISNTNRGDRFRQTPPLPDHVPPRDLTREGVEPNPGPFKEDFDHGSTIIMTTSQPNPSTLFVDGVLLVFSFLSFVDLLPALRSCHYWHSCSLKERSRQLTFNCMTNPSSNLTSVFNSPTRFHVGTVSKFSPHHLTLISQLHQLSKLTKLSCEFESANELDHSEHDTVALVPSTLSLPQTLTQLDVKISANCIAVDICQSFINIIPTGSNIRVIQFYEYSPMRSHHSFDLHPLTQLPLLTHFTLWRQEGFSSEDQEVCARLSLTVCEFFGLYRPDWRIFHPTCNFMRHIREWDWMDWTPTADDWTYLSSNRPPHLHTLSVSVRPSKLPVDLSSLGLATLSVTFQTKFSTDLDRSNYVFILQACQPSLTSLTLTDPNAGFTDGDLIRILMSLNHLTHLSLTRAIQGVSHQFLEYIPKQTTLQHLFLTDLNSFTEPLFKNKRVESIHIMEIILLHGGDASSYLRLKLDEFCLSILLHQLVIERLHGEELEYEFIRIHHDPPARNGSMEAHEYEPPVHDLTQYGVESNPGPSSNLVNDTVTVLSSATAQLVFKEGLHLIYSYLHLNDWLNGMVTCHHWFESGRTQPSRQLMAYYDTPSPGTASTPTQTSSSIITNDIPEMTSLGNVALHLRRHFTRLGYRSFITHPIAPITLFRIIRDFPNLIDIRECLLSKDASSLAECQWPIGLTSIKMCLLQPECPILFGSLSRQLSHQLTDLSITLTTHHGMSWLKSIEEFTCLTSLTIEYESGQPIDFIREVPWTRLPQSLAHLSLQHGWICSLDSIQSIPPLFNLTSFDISKCDLRTGDLERFHSVVPNMTWFFVTRCDLRQFEDLVPIRLFESLHSIVINSGVLNCLIQFRRTPTDLISILSECPSLTKLSFDGDSHSDPFTCANWLELSAFISQLQQLEFCGAYDFTQLCQAITVPNSFNQLERLIINSVYSQDLFNLLNQREKCQRLTYFFMTNYRPGEVFEFDSIHGINVDRYRLPPSPYTTTPTGINDINTTPPPSPPGLVGIELNPGPFDPMDNSILSSYSTPPTQLVTGRFLKDMIHLINSFLNDSDWISSMCVCHHWLICGSSSPTRHIAYPIADSGLAEPVPPKLLHHFTSLFSPCPSTKLVDRRHIQLTPNLLSTISQQLPHLTSIQCELRKCPKVDEASVVWPVHLTDLDLDLQNCVNTKLISSIFYSHSITTLSLERISPHESMTIFQGVNQLVDLKYLNLCIDTEPIDQLLPFDALEAMKLTHLPTHLKYFNFCNGEPAFFRLHTLGQMTPASELEELNLDFCEMDVGELEFIHQFAPNLICMELGHCHPSNFITLKQFESLQELHLLTSDEMHASYTADESSLISNLAAATQLTSLHFDNCWIPTTSASWLQLSEGLIHLTALDLTIDQFASLDILRTFHSLESIEFTVCTMDPTLFNHIRHFFSSSEVLPNLQRISIFTGYGGSLSFKWVAGQTKFPHYRSKKIDESHTSANPFHPSASTSSHSVHEEPPAAPLIGIEPNPGPIKSNRNKPKDVGSTTAPHSNVQPIPSSSVRGHSVASSSPSVVTTTSPHSSTVTHHTSSMNSHSNPTFKVSSKPKQVIQLASVLVTAVPSAPKKTGSPTHNRLNPPSNVSSTTSTAAAPATSSSIGPSPSSITTSVRLHSSADLNSEKQSKLKTVGVSSHSRMDSGPRPIKSTVSPHSQPRPQTQSRATISTVSVGPARPRPAVPVRPAPLAQVNRTKKTVSPTLTAATQLLAPTPSIASSSSDSLSNDTPETFSVRLLEAEMSEIVESFRTHPELIDLSVCTNDRWEESLLQVMCGRHRSTDDIYELSPYADLICQKIAQMPLHRALNIHQRVGNSQLDMLIMSHPPRASGDIIDRILDSLLLRVQEGLAIDPTSLPPNGEEDLIVRHVVGDMLRDSIMRWHRWIVGGETPPAMRIARETFERRGIPNPRIEADRNDRVLGEGILGSLFACNSDEDDLPRLRAWLDYERTTDLWLPSPNGFSIVQLAHMAKPISYNDEIASSVIEIVESEYVDWRDRHWHNIRSDLSTHLINDLVTLVIDYLRPQCYAPDVAVSNITTDVEPPHDPPTATVPSTRLVGIELNPGPSLISSTIEISTQPRSSSRTFFKDGLLSIFSFLTLADLLPALQSCHYWYDIGQREKCRSLTYSFVRDDIDRTEPFTSLLHMLRSPFRFHISTIQPFNDKEVITLAEVNQICLANLPHLTHLSGCLLELPTKGHHRSLFTPSPFDVSSMYFPSGLLSLECRSWDEKNESCYQIVLNRISTQLTQLEHLMWSIVLCYTSVDFNSLLNLSHLTSLDLKYWRTFRSAHSGSPPAAPNIQSILSQLKLRSLSHCLESAIDWSIWTAETPLMKHLEEWSLHSTPMTNYDWSMLGERAPKLKYLIWSFIINRNFMDVHLLTSLRQLDLYDHTNVWSPEPGQVTRLEIQKCSQLTSLNFYVHAGFSQLDWSRMLEALPLLESFRCTEISLRPYEQTFDMFQYCPPTTIISGIKCAVKKLIKSLELSTKMRELTLIDLDWLNVLMTDEAHFIQFRELCSSASWSTCALHRISIRTKSQPNINCTYEPTEPTHTITMQHDAIAVTPPSPPLIGIETNPGPARSTPLHPEPPSTDTNSNTVTHSTVPSAQTLFKDGLRIVFQFLDTYDWGYSLCTCWHWYTIGSTTTTPSRHLSMPLIKGEYPFSALPPPHVIHHITTIHNDDDADSTVNLTSSQLVYLVNLLPSLTSLNCTLRAPPIAVPGFTYQQILPSMDIPSDSVINWSPRIRTITIHFISGPQDYTNLIRTILQSTSLPNSLDSLALIGDFSVNQSVFSLLASFHHLRALQLTCRSLNILSWNLSSFPPDLVDLRLDEVPLETLFGFSFPHLTQLNRVGGVKVKSNQLSQLHTAMPNLTHLNLEKFSPIGLNQIGLFTRLESIQFGCLQFDASVPVPTDFHHSLISGLTSCTHLTHCYFSEFSFGESADTWEEFSQRLPSVTSLSLGFFARASLNYIVPAHIKRLEVYKIRSYLEYLERFIELEELNLNDSHDDSLHEHTQPYFAQPHILPHLRCIRFNAAYGDDFEYNLDTNSNINYRTIPITVDEVMEDEMSVDHVETGESGDVTTSPHNPIPMCQTAEELIESNSPAAGAVPSPRLVGIELNPGPVINLNPDQCSPSAALSDSDSLQLETVFVELVNSFITPLPISTRNNLSNMIHQVTSFVLGPYLTDADANSWAQCSHRSLQQLQHRSFYTQRSIDHVVRLSLGMRPAEAFGQIVNTRITLADEWINQLPKLYDTGKVQRLLLDVTNGEELQQLCEREDVASKQNSSTIIRLPNTVVELEIGTGSGSVFSMDPTWVKLLQHLKLPSYLRVLHLPRYWPTDIPPFILSLPDTITDLRMPNNLRPDEWPKKWPSKLQTLRCQPRDIPLFAQLPTTLPSTLTCLDTGEWWDRPVTEVKLPLSITTIDWIHFNHPIPSEWEPPPALKYLALWGLNQSIDSSLVLPSGLCELHLVQCCPPCYLPDSIHTLTIDCHPHDVEPFEGFRWPKNLHTLHLGWHVKQSLRNWAYPSTLTSLWLTEWNLPLTELSLPSTLQSLRFTQFNQSLVGFSFPTHLEHLDLGEQFQQSLRDDKWIPPPNLNSLKLAWNWNMPLHELYLPPTLTRLFWGSFTISSLAELGKILPIGLRELSLAGAFLHASDSMDSLQLPPNLRCLHLPSLTSLESTIGRMPSVSQVPRSLREVHVHRPPPYWPTELLRMLKVWAKDALPTQCAFLWK